MSKKIALQIGEESKYCGSNLYAGCVNKFNYLIRYDDSSLCFTISYNIEGKKDFSELSKLIKKINKSNTLKFNNNVLSIVGVCNNSNSLPRCVNPLIDIVSNYLNDNNYKELCKFCKKDKKVSLIDNDGEINYYCNDCYQKFLKEAKSIEKTSKMVKERMVLGIIGSFICMIPGIVAWCLLNYLNVEPGIAGIFITMGSALGFKWLGKSVKTSGMIASIIIGLLGIFIAHELSCSIYIYELYRKSYDINVWNAFKSIPYYLGSVSDFKKLFYNQLSTGYLLSLIGVFSSYSLHRQSIFTYDIKRIGE